MIGLLKTMKLLDGMAENMTCPNAVFRFSIIDQIAEAFQQLKRTCICMYCQFLQGWIGMHGNVNDE